MSGMDAKTWTAAHMDAIGISTYCAARRNGPVGRVREELLCRNPQVAYLYSLKVLHSRFPAGEAAISRSPEWAVRYARFVLKGRFRLAERFIVRSPRWAFEYAERVVRGRLPMKMHRRIMSISGDEFADMYARFANRAEKAIMRPNPEEN